MFVTLQDFFDNYRIKNNQQPNETVLNRGLMRLKREIRELKDILSSYGLGGTSDNWSSSINYEIGQYTSFNNKKYKSRINQNNNHEPFEADNTFWELQDEKTSLYIKGPFNDDADASINGISVGQCYYIPSGDMKVRVV